MQHPYTATVVHASTNPVFPSLRGVLHENSKQIATWVLPSRGPAGGRPRVECTFVDADAQERFGDSMPGLSTSEAILALIM